MCSNSGLISWRRLSNEFPELIEAAKPGVRSLLVIFLNIQ